MVAGLAIGAANGQTITPHYGPDGGTTSVTVCNDTAEPMWVWEYNGYGAIGGYFTNPVCRDVWIPQGGCRDIVIRTQPGGGAFEYNVVANFCNYPQCVTPGMIDINNDGLCDCYDPDEDDDCGCAGERVMSQDGLSCDCPFPKVEDGNGACACPGDYVDNGNGGCDCPAGKVSDGNGGCECEGGKVDDGFGGCACPVGKVDNGSGGCCDDPDGDGACGCGPGTVEDPGPLGGCCNDPDGDGACGCGAGKAEDATGGCCDDPDSDGACGCAAGTLEDGNGGCCDDANGDGNCDCGAGQIDDGDGGCCDDADGNFNCDEFDECDCDRDLDEVLYIDEDGNEIINSCTEEQLEECDAGNCKSCCRTGEVVYECDCQRPNGVILGEDELGNLVRNECTQAQRDDCEASPELENEIADPKGARDYEDLYERFEELLPIHPIDDISQFENETAPPPLLVQFPHPVGQVEFSVATDEVPVLDAIRLAVRFGSLLYLFILFTSAIVRTVRQY